MHTTCHATAINQLSMKDENRKVTLTTNLVQIQNLPDLSILCIPLQYCQLHNTTLKYPSACMRWRIWPDVHSSFLCEKAVCMSSALIGSQGLWRESVRLMNGVNHTQLATGPPPWAPHPQWATLCLFQQHTATSPADYQAVLDDTTWCHSRKRQAGIQSLTSEPFDVEFLPL